MKMIEVGMYVRTKDGIKQIYEIDSNKTKWKYLYKLRHQDEDGTIDLGMLCDDDIIGEPSYNPIDLIEENDIILGKDGNIYQVDNVDRGYIFTYNFNDEGEFIILVDYQIDKILTHEQFENNCYKIGN